MCFSDFSQISCWIYFYSRFVNNNRLRIEKLQNIQFQHINAYITHDNMLINLNHLENYNFFCLMFGNTN